jgi:nucleoside-diphosphate-sugar epimerase
VNHFVYEAISKQYLVVFEKDFKRNFVHVRDVADCFVHCLAHAGSMAGRAYNCGRDDANVSKGELAERIRVHVPEFYVHYADIGRDPDRRNYIVSNQRLREAGFEAKRTLDEGILELLKGYRMMATARPSFANA